MMYELWLSTADKKDTMKLVGRYATEQEATDDYKMVIEGVMDLKGTDTYYTFEVVNTGDRKPFKSTEVKRRSLRDYQRIVVWKNDNGNVYEVFTIEQKNNF